MKHIIHSLALALSLFFIATAANGQGMSMNTTGTAADASAMLDVASTSKGMLVPRMTTTQRTGISNPAKGLLVYDSTLASFYYNSGTTSSPSWTALGGSSLPSGSNGQVLTMVGTTPTWVSPLFYSIVAIPGSGGTISPPGVSGVNSGGSQVYTITPSSGSFVTSVAVDGISIGAVTSYTFTSVSSNHTISATFPPQ